MTKLLLFATFIFSSCTSQETKDIIEQKQLLVDGHIQDIEHFMPVNIDGCEYIINCSNSNSIIHKGNCKNPIHFKTK